MRRGHSYKGNTVSYYKTAACLGYRLDSSNTVGCQTHCVATSKGRFPLRKEPPHPKTATKPKVGRCDQRAVGGCDALPVLVDSCLHHVAHLTTLPIAHPPSSSAVSHKSRQVSLISWPCADAPRLLRSLPPLNGFALPRHFTTTAPDLLFCCPFKQRRRANRHWQRSRRTQPQSR